MNVNTQNILRFKVSYDIVNLPTKLEQLYFVTFKFVKISL